MLWRAVIAVSLILGCFSRCEGLSRPLKISVFYENSNTASALFIIHQLYKVWTEFKDYIKLHMVPIAIVQQQYRNGHIVFTCRGGRKECEINALHACAYHIACRGLELISCPTDQMSEALEYTKCMVQSKNQKEASKGCAWKFWLPSTEIDECAKGWVGETLQSYYANMTIAGLSLARMELPHIEIETDNDYSQEYARTNLRSLVCGFMPDKCWDSLEEV